DCSVWETASGTPEKVRIRISAWSVGSPDPLRSGTSRSRKYGMRHTPAAVTTPKSDSVIISPYSGPSGLGTGVTENGDGPGSAPGGSDGAAWGGAAAGLLGTASSGTWTMGGGVQVLGSDSGWEDSASREVNSRKRSATSMEREVRRPDRTSPGAHDTAMASISTFAPRGNAAAWTVTRAGGGPWKHRPYTSFTFWKSPMSARKMVVRTTCSKVSPPAARTARRFSITRSA